MHVHATTCCACIISAHSTLRFMHQGSDMVSRLDRRTTACRILVLVRTRLAEVEIGMRTVIALCKRYGGAALACADCQTVWHATRPCMACPRMRCPRPARV